jgi:sugar phosphate isomerase/epimerase
MLEGLRITTFNVGLAPWNSTDRAIRTAQAEFVAGSLRVAKATGAYAVTVPAGSKPKLASDWDVTARIAAETMRPVAKIAESLGLQLSIEIHLNTLVENVEQAEKMIELLQAPAVGVTLDTSHLAAQAMDPVAAITRLGSRIQHVHLRDAKPGNPLLTPGEGAVDFAGVARALREIHYDRYCALEMEYAPLPLAEIEENVRRGRAHIEQAFAETTG